MGSEVKHLSAVLRQSPQNVHIWDQDKFFENWPLGIPCWAVLTIYYIKIWKIPTPKLEIWDGTPLISSDF